VVLPTVRLGILVILLGLAGGLTTALGLPVWYVWGLLGFAALAAGLDAVWSVRARDLTVVRHMPERLYVGTANTIGLEVTSQAGSPVIVSVLDEAPLAFEAKPASLRALVTRARPGRGEYRVTPRERGDAPFGDLNLRWTGPFGLAMRQKRVPAAATGKVYPRYADYSRYLLEARVHLRREGAQRRRVAQRADEFESLRDYVPGDDTRRLDWKATARARRLIVRNYEEERSKDLMILVDAGRMMAPTADGLSKLDHAINAALMVASVAAERKDRVGLLVFAGEPILFLPPAHGKDQVQRFLDALYDVQVQLVEPDFAAAFSLFKARHRKRCLTILFTDLSDSDSNSQLLAHVGALAPSHLPLAITIRDQSLEDAATRPLTRTSEFYERAVAEQVLHERAIALASLRKEGVVVMDVPPRLLTVAAVNQYLMLRSHGWA
jgi:uncharacterized protein (DUF58 family)